MTIYVLDKYFSVIKIIENYISFIWTDRYREAGDFELYLPMDRDLLQYLRADNYLSIRESDHTMIIEKILIETDVEEGSFLTVTGRSLESILDRRIVWKEKTFENASVATIVKTIIREAITAPSIAARRIPNFVYTDVDDDIFTDTLVSVQYKNTDLYTAITDISKELSTGFQILLDSDNQFVFKLLTSTDRSYDQTDNPYVIFSPNFDNLINNNYSEDSSVKKTVALIGGKGDENKRVYTTSNPHQESGLYRREMYSNATNVSDQAEFTIDDSDGNVVQDRKRNDLSGLFLYSNAQYIKLLQKVGLQDLIENGMLIAFEGSSDTLSTYRYGRDFFMGDIVQLENEFGARLKARVIELVISDDDSGYSCYPSFEAITDEGE